MVEEVNANNATPPTITINNNGQGDGKLVVTEGKVGNLLDLITAVDYLGRTINVNIEGNYDLNVAGEYKITLVATDRLGNESRKDIVLTVEKAPVVPNQPDQPTQPDNQINRLNRINQINRLNRINQNSQVNQINRLNRINQNSQVNQMDQDQQIIMKIMVQIIVQIIMVQITIQQVII